MQKRLASIGGLIALSVAAGACGGRETTTIRRETVQTIPAAPAVVERRTTVVPAAPVVERKTTIESVPGGSVIERRTTVESAPEIVEKKTVIETQPPIIERRTETIETED